MTWAVHSIERVTASPACSSCPYSGLIRRWREGDLTLRARGKPPAPARTLYCYSPSFVPTPRDWPPDTIATGYWLREDAGDESLDLRSRTSSPRASRRFMSASEAASVPDPGQLSTVVSEALRKAGARGVIATGWGGIADLPAGADRMVIADAPHRFLFPRVAAVVHHGGRARRPRDCWPVGPPSSVRFKATNPSGVRRCIMRVPAPSPCRRRS